MVKPTDERTDREARLAAQLRDNLRRRKQQARGQTADVPPSQADQGPEPDAGGVADPPLSKASPGS